MATRVVTVNEILDGHVGLDLECFDRIYLNGWVHSLQVSGQVVNFLTHHLGFPIPSPAILERIGLRFRKAVTEFARDNGIEVIRFVKGDRKLEVMRPHLDRLAREGRCGVAAIGVAQEFQRVFTGTTYHPDSDGGGVPRFGYAKADHRVTAYYFYLVDEVFGAAFVKVCAYFPYPLKIWLNGHEYAKRAATAAGIGFTELDNGFAAAEDLLTAAEEADDGVVGGADVVEVSRPRRRGAGRGLVGVVAAWPSRWPGWCGHSAVTSATAVRAVLSSTMALSAAKAATRAWTAMLLSARG
ncbi:MAG TPA: hypothetical protein VE196_09425 [Pseudonocardiaceae bacterium]|nr:hypothetical protein [Pseudonocardiaceae bacterium]